MTTKYQIFVSSTFRDLKEHRSSAMKAIVSAGHMATCLENWGLSHEEQLKVISRAVKDCQFYLIILGHTYGSIPRGKRKSYTEIELDIAEAQGMPVLAMVLDEKIVKRMRKKLNPKDSDQRRELGNDDRYWTLRGRLCSHGRWHSWFRRPIDVEKDVLRYFSNPPDGIRGYKLETDETESLIHIAASNQVVRDIVLRTGDFAVVEGRLKDAEDRKRAIASAFRDLHGRQLGLLDKLFIESGSTLTYIAAEVARHLPKSLTVVPLRAKYTAAKPMVTTNNALAYLDLWLVNGVLCSPEPDFPPGMSEPYGAMYGPLTGLSRQPDYSGRPIEEDDPDAWAAVCRIRDDFVRGVHDPDKSLVLAAASAMQLAPMAVSDDDSRNAATCNGFHVGSYENKLFKRALYLTRVPTIVFLHDDKVGANASWGRCHYVFDNRMTWESVLSEYPLSIWVGCTKGSVGRVEASIRQCFPETWQYRTYGAAELPVLVRAQRSVSCEGGGG